MGFPLSRGGQSLLDDKSRGHHDACRNVPDLCIFRNIRVSGITPKSRMGSTNGASEPAGACSNIAIWWRNRQVCTISIERMASRGYDRSSFCVGAYSCCYDGQGRCISGSPDSSLVLCDCRIWYDTIL